MRWLKRNRRPGVPPGRRRTKFNRSGISMLPSRFPVLRLLVKLERPATLPPIQGILQDRIQPVIVESPIGVNAVASVLGVPLLFHPLKLAQQQTASRRGLSSAGCGACSGSTTPRRAWCAGGTSQCKARTSARTPPRSVGFRRRPAPHRDHIRRTGYRARPFGPAGCRSQPPRAAAARAPLAYPTAVQSPIRSLPSRAGRNAAKRLRSSATG